MSTHNYLVSVFVDGKHINSYFSECLDDLITIRALHKGCDISIFDLKDFSTLTKEHVEAEIKMSGDRWKKSMDNTTKDVPEEPKKAITKRCKKKKLKKNWERPVMCVETGQIFPSIKNCVEHLGLSHKSLWNAINSGKARNGLHFVNVERKTD